MSNANAEPEEEARAEDDFPILYSQQAMVGVSFYDFSLVFFQESYRGNHPVANIAIPPAAAKLLAETLSEYVETYEAEYGEIRLPPAREDEDESDEEEYSDDDDDEA
jgi:hypothetical protein